MACALLNPVANLSECPHPAPSAMRPLQSSPHATQCCTIVGPNVLFACGLSHPIRRSRARVSPCQTCGVEPWATAGGLHSPRRLAGHAQGSPRLAESVSATQASGRSSSGGIAGRRNRP